MTAVRSAAACAAAGAAGAAATGVAEAAACGEAAAAGGLAAATPVTNRVPGAAGSMFGVGGRYLQRNTDYRSVLGEVIRKHLGATQDQLNRIIPGYAVSGEHLLAPGGMSSIDGTQIRGEVGIL